VAHGGRAAVRVGGRGERTGGRRLGHDQSHRHHVRRFRRAARTATTRGDHGQRDGPWIVPPARGRWCVVSARPAVGRVIKRHTPAGFHAGGGSCDVRRGSG